ncbi:MAG: hypothetical protein ACFFAH_16175 [Promethearchaeota archaeon]
MDLLPKVFRTDSGHFNKRNVQKMHDRCNLKKNNNRVDQSEVIMMKLKLEKTEQRTKL